MRFLLIIFFLFIALPAHSAELEKRTTVHDGITREYWIYDPRANQTSGKRALVLVLHGGGGKADKFDVMTGKENSFNTLADREDILIAYPQGINKSWNDGREAPQVDAQAREIDDTGFLSGLIDSLVNSRNVDPKRVYVVGPSNGGHMSNRLACDISGKVAAVGIVIGLMPKKYVDKCKPETPVSVLIMNGTEDPLVPYNGGDVKLFKRGRSRGEDISTEDTFAFWLKHAGYDGKPDAIAAKQLPDADPDDKTRITMRSFKGAQSQVVLYTVTGGGHTWPGGRQYLFESLVGRVSRDINATEVIWDFFKDAAKP
ncbi:MAG: PHB depolymerase family esterase [Alphaproteobacteria bacterium]